MLGAKNKQASKNSQINTSDIDINAYKPNGYKDGEIITDMPYIIINGENIINVIYTKKDNLTYRVEYYYDGNIDSSKTEYFENLTYGDVITNYKEKLQLVTDLLVILHH